MDTTRLNETTWELDTLAHIAYPAPLAVVMASAVDDEYCLPRVGRVRHVEPTRPPAQARALNAQSKLTRTFRAWNLAPPDGSENPQNQWECFESWNPCERIRG